MNPQVPDQQFWGTNLAVDFEPHIPLGAALNNRADGHQADDEGLALLDGDVHLLSDIGTAQEVARWDDAEVAELLHELLVLLEDLFHDTNLDITSRVLQGRVSHTLGYITYDETSASVMCLPNLARSSALIFLKLRGSRLAPGRPSILGLFLMMLLRRGSGNPPTGWPR